MEKCENLKKNLWKNVIIAFRKKNPATEVTGLLGLIGDNISQSFHSL